MEKRFYIIDLNHNAKPANYSGVPCSTCFREIIEKPTSIIIEKPTSIIIEKDTMRLPRYVRKTYYPLINTFIVAELVDENLEDIITHDRYTYVPKKEDEDMDMYYERISNIDGLTCSKMIEFDNTSVLKTLSTFKKSDIFRYKMALEKTKKETKKFNKKYLKSDKKRIRR